MIKKGSYVRIKVGTNLETGEKVTGWGGRIDEVYNNERSCLVILDAQTIDSMEEVYLLDCIEEGADPAEYIFSFDDLEIGERRDNPEQLERSLDKLASRVLKLEDGEVGLNEELQEEWINQFLNSDLFASQTDVEKENSIFTIETFMDYLYNYENVTPDNWMPNNIMEVCLNIVPRKITSDLPLFEVYGKVVENFLSFLGINNHIINSKELIETVRDIRHRIPIEAKNPNNWGMAKSMMMSAKESGVDLANEEELNSYIFKQNEGLIASESNVLSLKSNPFKGIGRNQKVTVKYATGEQKEDIKFKKVEQDLVSGKCELMLINDGQ